MSHWYTDPFFWYTVSAFVSPAFSPKLPTDQMIAYFTNPYMLGAIGLGVATHFYTMSKVDKKSPALSTRDTRMARWFLINGCMFHFYSDFLVGAFGHDHKINDVEAKALAMCDKRYATSMNSEYGAPMHAVAWLEGLIMCPTTLLTYYAYHTRAEWRSGIEVAASMSQMFGTLIAVISAEIIGGSPFYEQDKRWSFDKNVLIYYWFGTVFATLGLYTVVPMYSMITALKNTQTRVAVDNDKKNK